MRDKKALEEELRFLLDKVEYKGEIVFFMLSMFVKIEKLRINEIGSTDLKANKLKLGIEELKEALNNYEDVYNKLVELEKENNR